MDARLGIAFTVPGVVRELQDRPQPVSVLSRDGIARAQLRVGVLGFTLEVEAGHGPGAPSLQEFTLVPGTCVDATRCCEGLLSIIAAWPTFSVNLKFASEAEARAVHDRLRRAALAIVRSLHLAAMPGAPLLTLQPLPGCAVESRVPRERGSFLLGGYVIVSDMVNEDHPFLSTEDLVDIRSRRPEFCLYWSELCGPDELGSVCLYHYSSHHPDAVYADFTDLSRLGEYRLVGNVLRLPCPAPIGGIRLPCEVGTDEYITFRSADEAQLWVDAAMAVQEEQRQWQPGEPIARAAQRVSQVTSDLRLHAQASELPREPLLTDVSKLLGVQPEPEVPMDEVAMYWRELEQQDMRRLVGEAFEALNVPSHSFGPMGTTQFATTQFATTQFA